MKNIYDLLLIVICIVFFRSFIIKVINSHFEMYAYSSLEFFGFVWVGFSVYTRWKYDKEHEHNMTKGEGAIIGVILLVLILLFLHL